MAPVVIGYSYNLAPPLSSITCQRSILSALTPLGKLYGFFVQVGISILCHGKSSIMVPPQSAGLVSQSLAYLRDCLISTGLAMTASDV